MHSKRCVNRIFRLGRVIACVLLAITPVFGQDMTATLQDSAALRSIRAERNEAVSETRPEAFLQAQMRAQQLEQEERNKRTTSLRINPTNGVVPVRSSATSFADSPLYRDVNGNLQIGANPAPDSANGGLTMVGNLAVSHILEVHNNYAVGIDLHTHSDQDWRAPYINLLKTRGTQTGPTPVRFTGYEMDSIGGINFGGWDGSQYYAAAAILSQTDEDWDATHHGGHISIYGTNPGGHTQQLAQFGGVDPNDNPYVGNIIFYRPLTWGSNSAANVGLFPVGSERTLKVRTADDSADATLVAGTLIESTSHTPSSASDTCTTGQIAWDATFIYVCVAPNAWKRAAISSW